MSDRVFGTISNGEVEFVAYKPEFYEGVKEILYNDYFVGECLSNGFDVNLPENEPFREDLVNRFCLDTLADGLSIVARDTNTKQIVGHVVNRLITKDVTGGPSRMELYLAHKCHTVGSKAFIGLMIDLEKRVDLFALRNTDVLLDVMFVGVSRAYARRSIGSKLIEYSLQVGRELKAGQSLERLPLEKRSIALRVGGATALFTSNYSKSIGERLGFVTHDEVFYDQIEFDGKRMQDGIPNPLQRSMKLASIPF